MDIARTLVQEAEVLLGDLKASFLEVGRVSKTAKLSKVQTTLTPL